MRTFNDESLILEEFRDLHKSEIVLVGSQLQCFKVHKALTSIFNRRYWINSSKKSDPPPDYYNDKKRLMMELTSLSIIFKAQPLVTITPIGHLLLKLTP